VDSAANVYVSNLSGNTLQEFSSNFASHTLTSTATVGSYGSGAGQFNGPQFIATDNSGDIYVADAFNSRVDRYFDAANWTSGTANFVNAAEGPGQVLAGDSAGDIVINPEMALNVSGTLALSGFIEIAGGTLNAPSIVGTGDILVQKGTANVQTIYATTVEAEVGLTIPASGGLNLSGDLDEELYGAVVMNGYGHTAQIQINGADASFVQTSPTFYTDDMEVKNGGTFNIASGNSIIANQFNISGSASGGFGTTVNINGGQIKTGYLSIASGSTLNLISGNISHSLETPAFSVLVLGQLTLGGYTQATIDNLHSFSNYGVMSGSGQITFTDPSTAVAFVNGGEINLQASDRLLIGYMTDNYGQIYLAGNLTIHSIDNSDQGKIILSGGTLTITSSSEFDASAPTLALSINNESYCYISGHGTIEGSYPFENEGSVQLSDGDSDIYPAILNQNLGTISVTGNSTVTFYSPMSLYAGSKLTVGPNAMAVFLGAVTGTSTISGAGTFDFEGGQSATPALANLGGVTVGSLAVLSTPSVQVGDLIVSGNLALAKLSVGQTQVIDTANSLLITPGGKLDLANNTLLVSYTGASPAVTIRGYLTAGYDQGRWDGSGLDSSVAGSSANGSTTLGYIDTGTIVEIKYTWVGDANLDGVVNSADLGAIKSDGATWATGDFNYDSKVNSDDYALYMLGAAYGKENISATLPEPSMVIGALPLLIFAGRRTQRNGRR
jgi:hypothetical protein